MLLQMAVVEVDQVQRGDVRLRLARGEFVALIGPSVSGKSTRLDSIGRLGRDAPVRAGAGP